MRKLCSDTRRLERFAHIKAELVIAGAKKTIVFVCESARCGRDWPPKKVDKVAGNVKLQCFVLRGANCPASAELPFCVMKLCFRRSGKVRSLRSLSRCRKRQVSVADMQQRNGELRPMLILCVYLIQ